MKIEDSFRVEVPVEEAWKVLLDLERIAPCLPGAQLTEVEGDEYRGTVKIKVGPITAQYKGVAKIEEADEANRKVVLQAEGRDTRGQGNASATVTATLVPDGDGTTVNIDTDLNITGKVAQFGRGVMADVSSKLLGQFADNLKRDVLSGGASQAADEPGARRGGDCGRRGHRADGGSAPARQASRKIESKEAEPIDLMDAAGGSVGKRIGPIIAGLVVLLALRADPQAAQAPARSATPRTDPSRIEPVFDPSEREAPAGAPRLVLGIDPGVSRCGYGVVRRDGSTFRAVAYGVIRTPPRDELPDRLATLLARARRAHRRVPARSAMAVERVLFQVNTRTAMSVGQASGLALALAGARRGAGRALQPQRGEARGRRRRRRRQVRGAADGDAAPAAGRRAPIRPTPPTRSRSRSATGGGRRSPPPVPGRRPRRRASAPRRLGWRTPSRPRWPGRRRPVIGSVRGTVLERTAAGEVLVEVGGVGYRVLVPGRRAAGAAPGRRRVPVHAPARARGRDGALRLPDARRARHLRGADRAPPASGPKLALAMLSVHSPRGAAARAARRRPRRAHDGARRRQAHRAAAAGRAQGPPRGARARPHRGGRARRAPRAEVRDALGRARLRARRGARRRRPAARGRARSRSSSARR